MKPSRKPARPKNLPNERSTMSLDAATGRRRRDAHFRRDIRERFIDDQRPAVLPERIVQLQQ